MKNDRPGSRLTSANDSGRPVIPLETWVPTLNPGIPESLDRTEDGALPIGGRAGFHDPKPATSALRLSAPDAQKQPSLSTRPNHCR
jgi:hypothetical protein